MSKKNNPSGEGLREYRLTKKGIAYLLAVEHGLVPKVNEKYDIERFERFWNELETELRKREIEPEMEQLNYKPIPSGFLISALIISILALLGSIAKLFLA